MVFLSDFLSCAWVDIHSVKRNKEIMKCFFMGFNFWLLVFSFDLIIVLGIFDGYFVFVKVKDIIARHHMGDEVTYRDRITDVYL